MRGQHDLYQPKDNVEGKHLEFKCHCCPDDCEVTDTMASLGANGVPLRTLRGKPFKPVLLANGALISRRYLGHAPHESMQWTPTGAISTAQRHSHDLAEGRHAREPSGLRRSVSVTWNGSPDGSDLSTAMVSDMIVGQGPPSRPAPCFRRAGPLMDFGCSSRKPLNNLPDRGKLGL